MFSQMFSLICLLATILPLGSLKIVQSPDMNLWVEEGRNVSLVCASDHPWQFCYWEREILNNKTTYQTVQEYTSLDTYDPSIKFYDLQDTSCGIQIIGASLVKHQVLYLHLEFFLPFSMLYYY